MKLRNKKTGEIIETNILYVSKYKTLTELNEEWEDYEEPKEPKELKKYWFISAGGEVNSYYEEDEEPEDTEACKEIGNYFETKEEAEQAVEKLKAWKRLKDNGFKFQFWTSSYKGDDISFFVDRINSDSKKEIENDLDLLFGGEE